MEYEIFFSSHDFAVRKKVSKFLVNFDTSSSTDIIFAKKFQLTRKRRNVLLDKFENFPCRYMHMLQHVYRSKNFTKPNQYIKCFHNPERVVTLHNHFPLACLGAGCTSYPIETEDAQLQHYRADCVRSLKKTCVEYRENSVIDTTIWRYRDKLIRRVTDTLKTLGFFGTR